MYTLYTTMYVYSYIGAFIIDKLHIIIIREERTHWYPKYYIIIRINYNNSY